MKIDIPLIIIILTSFILIVTIFVSSKPVKRGKKIMTGFRKLFRKECNHKWVVVVNKELDSAYEQLTKQGENFDSLFGATWGIDLFRKIGLIIMVCEECGEINKTIVDTIGRRGEF